MLSLVALCGAALAVVVALPAFSTGHERASERAGNLVAREYRMLDSASISRTSVPRVIPAGGVAIVAPSRDSIRGAVLLYLHQAIATPAMLTEAEAEQAALGIDNAPGLSVTRAVLASVTIPSEVPPSGTPALRSAVIGTTAWVVTVFSPVPVDMSTSCGVGSASAASTCPQAMVSYNIMILNPDTGALLGGIFS
jgi:hypothetical protein